MNKSRKQIEKIKAGITSGILSGKNQYKHSIIRSIERIYLRNSTDGSIDLQELTRDLKRNLKVPDGFKNEIIKKVYTSQQEISGIWNEYFGNATGGSFSVADIDKMHALYQVDFTPVETEVRNKVLKEVRSAIKGEYGFNSISKKLQNTGLGVYTAENLTRTALAQFDNAYHVEVAKQAGVVYYIYDGDTSENTRPFCRSHIGRVYTLAELASMDNKQGLPVTTSLGGYRCQHFLTALIGYERKEPGEVYNPAHQG